MRSLASLVLLLIASPPEARAAARDGAPEPAITAPGPAGDYLRAVHQRVHGRWAGNFLRLAAEKLPRDNPLNDRSRAATAQVVIATDGQIISTRIVASSGFSGFDDAVLEVLRDAVPFPSPAPVEVRSDDETVRLRWTFARDERRCSAIELVRAEDPLDRALPKLLRDNRAAEALRRVKEARAAGGGATEATISALAIAWTKQSLSSPSGTVHVARTLAERGDPSALRWLQIAVRRPELAADAGAALAASKVPICPLMKRNFESQNWADHQSAAIALATAGEPDCAPALLQLFRNDKARPEARAAAVTALAAIPGEPSARAVADALASPSPTIRAAAILATARADGGRKKLFTLTPLLRDRSPEIRAAAAAAVVRTAGDLGLPELYVVFKDKDHRPAEAVARELASLRTQPATDLLVRLLRRPDAPVQIAAARALLQRSAVSAFPALRTFLAADAPPELKRLALVAADPPTLDRLATDPMHAAGVFRAYVARGERDRAAEWLLGPVLNASPAEQANAFADWLATNTPPVAARSLPAAPAAASSPAAPKR